MKLILISRGIFQLREPGLESPANWGPKKGKKNNKIKRNKKKTFCQQMTILGSFPSSWGKKNCSETKQINFFTKTGLLTISVDIWEVWGCPGAWHGPYEAIPSNFGRVWSYMAWGRSIFMFLGNIGNTLHHQIPPN